MHRRFQYSLQWLLIVMAVIAAFFGGIAFERERKRREEERIARYIADPYWNEINKGDK